jgi:hypothetical protein
MLNVNLQTKGSDFLTYQENTTIFNPVFSIIYISWILQINLFKPTNPKDELA